MGKMSTPHARGSTLRRLGHRNGGSVYPACAGIHPSFIFLPPLC